jgi:hypothetical protein
LRPNSALAPGTLGFGVPSPWLQPDAPIAPTTSVTMIDTTPTRLPRVSRCALDLI